MKRVIDYLLVVFDFLSTSPQLRVLHYQTFPALLHVERRSLSEILEAVLGEVVIN
jgi:hypothetical protein